MENWSRQLNSPKILCETVTLVLTLSTRVMSSLFSDNQMSAECVWNYSLVVCVCVCPYITWFTGEGAWGVVCKHNGHSLSLGVPRQPCDILYVANLCHLGNRVQWFSKVTIWVDLQTCNCFNVKYVYKKGDESDWMILFIGSDANSLVWKIYFEQ